MLRENRKLVLNLRYMFCLLIAMATIPSVFSQITAPTEIAGISAWWCADSVQQESGTPVSFWNNLVNTTESVSQPVANNSPTLVKDVAEVNNHAVLRFDGNDYLDGGNIMNVGSVGQTVIILGKTDKTAVSFYSKSVQAGSEGRVYYLYNNSAPHFQIQIGTNNFVIKGENRLSTYECNSTYINLNDAEMMFFQDNIGVQKISIAQTKSINTRYNFLIGAYNNTQGTIPPYSGFYLNGDIAEMIFYNRPLSNIERQSVENYLRSKYFPGTEREQFSLGGEIEQEYSLKPITLTVPERSYFQTYLWSTGENTQSISVTKSGLYAVHVTDDWGYDYIDTVVVSMPTIRNIPDQTICDGSSVTWNCGLSGDYTYEWSSGETTQEISITKAGKYAVKITDNQGYSIVSDTVTIEVDDFSTTARLGADTTLCKGNSIGLVSCASEAKQYKWNTGDTTATLTIENAGTYSVVVTDEGGCSATDEIQVELNGVAPHPQIVTQYRCFGDETELISNSFTTDNTQIVATRWVVESDTLEGAVQQHVFSESGVLPVEILVENDEGCIASLTEYVIIDPKPVAKFSPKRSCQYTENLITSISTVSSGTIATYEWNGIGKHSSDSVFRFLSDTVGEYHLSLKVVTDKGCEDTFEENIRVFSSTKLQIEHSAVCLGDTALIIDRTQYETFNARTDAYWVFDSTKFRYNTMLVRPMKDTLPHFVGLYVKTLNGCLNVVTDTIQAGAIPYPVVPERIYGCKKTGVQLYDEAYSEETVASVVWNINGKTLDEVRPVVEFAEAGEYTYSVTEMTAENCKNSAEGVVVIEETPTVDFSYYPEYGAAPLEVEFTNLSDGATDYEWTFEQSVVVDDENPTYTFEDKTNSYAKLRASSEHGCSDSVIKMIPVQLSDMQLRVTDVDARINRGMIQYSIQILNTGNDVIPEMEVALSSSDFATMSETWYGALKPNDVLTYVFPAKTVAKNDELPDYVCATATISSSSQNASYYSNQYCKDNTKEFTLYHIAPNPVEKTTTLLFSTSQAGTVTISCVDNTGKVRMVQEMTNMPAGVHSLTLDCRDIPSGKYLLQIEQGKKKISTNFVKE